MPQIRRVALITFLLLASSGGLLCQTASENQVKAAYLYNFAKLAQWPAEALPSASSPLMFCVFGGDDEFVGILRTTLAGKSIGSHSLAVMAGDAAREMSLCNIVFFRGSEKGRTPDAITSLKRSGVLLVGEDGNFLAQGGMLNLVLRDGKIRFQVNGGALQSANIVYDASFLAMAANDASGGTVQSGGTRGLRSSSQPQLPDIARQMNLSGAVQLEVVVLPDGSVKDVRVVGGHPLLARVASDAVRQWKYRPAQGETVELVKISFGQ